MKKTTLEKVTFDEGWPYIEYLSKRYPYKIYELDARKTAKKVVRNIWQVFYGKKLRGVIYITEAVADGNRMLFLDAYKDPKFKTPLRVSYEAAEMVLNIIKETTEIKNIYSTHDYRDVKSTKALHYLGFETIDWMEIKNVKGDVIAKFLIFSKSLTR